MAKGINKELAEEILSLEPTAKLEFYLIYFGPIENNDFIAVHSSQNGINGIIYWQGTKYEPYNIQSSGWEIKNDQTLPRPKLIISNKNFIVSRLLKLYDNLNNSKVIRKVTYARFLDDRNFANGSNPFGDANPNAGAPDQKFYISRVVGETKEKVEFELVSPLELENQKLPNRKIHSFRCPFIYRGYGCNYAGPPVATSSNDIIAIKNTDEEINADLILNAENNFNDASNSRRGSFAAQRTDINQGQGLYTEDGDFPVISTQEKIVGNNSFYFDGKSAIILCQENVPGSLSQERNQDNRAVSFWFRMDTGETRGYIDLIDFGDTYGGFGIYLQKKISSNDYYLVAALRDVTERKFLFDETVIINAGDWYHVVFTYTNMNNGNAYIQGYNYPFALLYINNNEIRRASISTPNDRINLLNRSISGIGGGFNTTLRDSVEYVKPENESGFRLNEAFKGYMDDVRFFLNPLTARSVSLLFQKKETPVLVGQVLSNKGEYQDNITYSKGDFVSISNRKYLDNLFNRDIKTFYVSIEDGNNTNPLTSSKWVKDSCGKSLQSCAIRFGNGIYLPFGGFPGTHKYSFSQKQNGY